MRLLSGFDARYAKGYLKDRPGFARPVCVVLATNVPLVALGLFLYGKAVVC